MHAAKNEGCERFQGFLKDLYTEEAFLHSYSYFCHFTSQYSISLQLTIAILGSFMGYDSKTHTSQPPWVDKDMDVKNDGFIAMKEKNIWR